MTKEKLTELKTKIKSLQKTLEEAENSIFNELRDSLFDENPTLKKFSFRGWTPSFNDGDPCKFSCDLNYPSVNGYDSGDAEWEDGKEHSKEKLKETEKLSENVSEVLSILPESFYERKFGSYGFEVTVTKEKITIDEYDCGY